MDSTVVKIINLDGVSSKTKDILKENAYYKCVSYEEKGVVVVFKEGLGRGLYTVNPSNVELYPSSKVYLRDNYIMSDLKLLLIDINLFISDSILTDYLKNTLRIVLENSSAIIVGSYSIDMLLKDVKDVIIEQLLID